MAIAPQPSFDQGRVFGRTFSVIGRNIGLWLGLAIIFSALPTLVFGYLTLDSTAVQVDAEPQWRVYLDGFGGVLISLVLDSLLTSALVRATIEDLSGKRPSIGDSIRAALAVLLPAIGLGLLTGIAVVIGLILLVVPGVILWLRWSVAVPVLVQERSGVIASMDRSAALTSGYRWALFGLFLILVIATGLIQWAIAMIEPMLGTLPGLFVAALTESMASMVLSTAAAVSYVELRSIKEGTSVDELAEIFF